MNGSLVICNMYDDDINQPSFCRFSILEHISTVLGDSALFYCDTVKFRITFIGAFTE